MFAVLNYYMYAQHTLNETFIYSSIVIYGIRVIMYDVAKSYTSDCRMLPTHTWTRQDVGISSDFLASNFHNCDKRNSLGDTNERETCVVCVWVSGMIMRCVRCTHLDLEHTCMCVIWTPNVINVPIIISQMVCLYISQEFCIHQNRFTFSKL